LTASVTERLEGDGATVAQLVGDVDRAAAGAERCGEQEARNLGAVLGVVGDGAQAVRLGFAQQRSRAVLVIAERDGVGAALAHLRALGAEKDRSGAEQCIRLAKDGGPGRVALVEATRDQPGQLKVRQPVGEVGVTVL